MAITEFLPKEYGYVVLVLVFYCFINFWMGFQVGKARKRYGTRVSRPECSGTHSGMGRFFRVSGFSGLETKTHSGIIKFRIGFESGLSGFGWVRSKSNAVTLERGHQNALEMMPMYFILMILGGMKHPCICTGLGLVYNISRFFYFKGYSTGDPTKRLTIGKYSFMGLFGLMICTISFGVTLIRG
ncbi:uncharacterized protein LOC130502364 [Raphanus sativus]|uniref:Uncharacterized protein LOC130502364 n=1 Tax=Raphanus sativus TaxID=3726 RepID=A0A9W3CNM7_RAPSA|nr:uncharacterized protein LOC130502364 [Raphanus sativus]